MSAPPRLAPPDVWGRFSALVIACVLQRPDRMAEIERDWIAPGPVRNLFDDLRTRHRSGRPTDPGGILADAPGHVRVLVLQLVELDYSLAAFGSYVRSMEEEAARAHAREIIDNGFDRSRLAEVASRAALAPEPLSPDAILAAAGMARFDVRHALTTPEPDPDWLLEDWIERGELVWLAGAGKSGKSMISLFLACAALAGAPSFLGRALGGIDWVVYIDSENRDRIVHRRLRWSGVPVEIVDRLDYITTRSADLGSPAGLAALDALTDRSGQGLVILDSLIGLHRIDEDSAGEVRQFALGLRSILEPRRATCIGLGHENRGGSMRGSLDWRNAADTVIELRKDDHGWRTLTIGDRRDGDESGRLVCRFTKAPNPAGPTPFLAIELGPGPKAGPSAAERMAEQIRDLRVAEPHISKRQAALRLGTTHDNGTFRKGWGLALGQASDVARGRGGPPVQGGPVSPTLPDGPLPDAELARLEAKAADVGEGS